MTQMNEPMTQEIINRMNSYSESRYKNQIFASERLDRNQQVKNLINELSEGVE